MIAVINPTAFPLPTLDASNGQAAPDLGFGLAVQAALGDAGAVVNRATAASSPPTESVGLPNAFPAKVASGLAMPALGAPLTAMSADIAVPHALPATQPGLVPEDTALPKREVIASEPENEVASTPAQEPLVSLDPAPAVSASQDPASPAATSTAQGSTPSGAAKLEQPIGKADLPIPAVDAAPPATDLARARPSFPEKEELAALPQKGEPTNAKHRMSRKEYAQGPRRFAEERMPAQTAMPLANDPNMMARLPIAGAQEIRTDWPRTIGGVVSDAPSKGAIAPAQASTAIRGDNLEITAADGAAAMPLPAPSSRDVSAAAEHPAGAALPDAPAFGIAALPATAENAPPARLIASAHVMSPPATVSGRPDAIGREMGVAIARHVDAGADAMTIRLDPIELGRIEVRMSFDQDGNLRTVMRAENPVALGLLRDDSAALGSALTKAGIQSDAQSFQFDSRSSGGGHNGQSSRQPHDPNPRWSASAYPDQETGPHQYRPFRTAANLDLIA